jgi:hypothetical protein
VINYTCFIKTSLKTLKNGLRINFRQVKETKPPQNEPKGQKRDIKSAFLTENEYQ